MPSPQGWPVPPPTRARPFPAGASRSVQCGHQNRKQSANRAAGIMLSLNPSSAPIKAAQATQQGNTKTTESKVAFTHKKNKNRTEITVAVTGFVRKVFAKL